VDLLTIHDNKFIVDDFTTNFCWRCHNKVVVGVLHRRARARDSHDDYHNNFFHNPQQNNSTMTSTKKPMNFYYRNQQQSTTTICCLETNNNLQQQFAVQSSIKYPTTNSLEISNFIMVCLSLMTVNKDCHVESAEWGCGMTVAPKG